VLQTIVIVKQNCKAVLIAGFEANEGGELVNGIVRARFLPRQSLVAARLFLHVFF